jgi:hypothetical protein
MVNTKFVVISFSHKKIFYLFLIFGIGKGERNLLKMTKEIKSCLLSPLWELKLAVFMDIVGSGLGP